MTSNKSVGSEIEDRLPRESRLEVRTFIISLHCPCGGEFHAKDGAVGLRGKGTWRHQCDRCRAFYVVKDEKYPHFERVPIPVEIPEDAAPHMSAVVPVWELVKQMAAATANSYMKTREHPVLEAIRR